MLKTPTLSSFRRIVVKVGSSLLVKSRSEIIDVRAP